MKRGSLSTHSALTKRLVVLAMQPRRVSMRRRPQGSCRGSLSWLTYLPWTAGLLCCCLDCSGCGGLPVPGQKLFEPLSGMAGDPSEDIRQPGMRVDVIHLGRDD
jgi:hypothetical protein